MKEYIIYRITNLINGKIYIGLTSQKFTTRMSQHKTNALTKKINHPLYNSIRKIGMDNFKMEIIEKCKNEDEMIEREIYYINLYNTTNINVGYNIQSGGTTTNHSNVTKNKILESKLSLGPIGSRTYRGVEKSGNSETSSYCSINNFGKIKHKKSGFRTELEAAFNVDIINISHYGKNEKLYLNFKDGKTVELIMEQLATKKLLENVKYKRFNIKSFKKGDYEYYMVRGVNIQTGKQFLIAYSSNLNECESKLDEFLSNNICLNGPCRSIIETQLAYEKDYGTIHNLYTEEELNEAIKNELGKFE